MSSQSDAYLTARAEFEKAHERVSEAGRFIQQVGTKIVSDPEAFYFTNTGLQIVITSAMSPSDGLTRPSGFSP